METMEDIAYFSGRILLWEKWTWKLEDLREMHGLFRHFCEAARSSSCKLLAWLVGPDMSLCRGLKIDRTGKKQVGEDATPHPLFFRVELILFIDVNDLRGG